MAGMRILVTGGLGTIGSGLVSELTARGHLVYFIDLSHSTEEIGFSLRTDLPDPRYARCDVGEYRQLERIFNTWGPFDFVYHCAAEFGRWNGEDFYEQLWQSNAVGTKNLIRLQEKLGFKLIHFSSSEVYGDWPNVMIENVMDKHEIKQMNDYAMTKWVNEMQIHNSATHYGTKSVIVRIFNTYGPGEYYSPYRSVNSRFIYCALKGIPWLVYKGYTRTSTYLADSVKTLCNIVENFKPGETYNVGGDQYHTVEEFSNLVLKITGADPGLVTYKEEEVLTTRHKKVDISKAIKDLNHKTTVNLETGIRNTVDWMRGVYKL
jgi:dTDP-glucose 4,6-dehydratase